MAPELDSPALTNLIFGSSAVSHPEVERSAHGHSAVVSDVQDASCPGHRTSEYSGNKPDSSPDGDEEGDGEPPGLVPKAIVGHRTGKRAAARLTERFWPKVNKDGPVKREDLGPCWVWTGARVNGYGVIRVGERLMKAPRVSWEIDHDSVVPDGLCVLHRCDNPPCIRPEHLFLGTYKDDRADMLAKGRGKLTEAEREEKRSLAKRPGAVEKASRSDDDEPYTPVPLEVKQRWRAEFKAEMAANRARREGSK